MVNGYVLYGQKCILRMLVLYVKNRNFAHMFAHICTGQQMWVKEATIFRLHVFKQLNVFYPVDELYIHLEFNGSNLY